jgi:hypothetical protein
MLLAEIFLTTPVGATGRRVVDTQLWIGGPVRDMLMLSGVFSVIVEWCEASASAALPGDVPRPIPQSTSMPKLFSLRYSDERAIPRVAAACTRFPPASRSAWMIASRSIDSSALSVLPEVWQQ